MNFPDQNYIKTHLRGCLELALFLKRGTERFKPTTNDFWLSFLIPTLLIPLNVIQAYAYPEFRDAPWSMMIVIFGYQVMISTAFFLGSVWLLCWPLERKAEFTKFGSAYNWLSITGVVISVPYMLLFVLTPLDADQLSHLLITTVGFFFCVLAFAIRYILNVSWVVALLITALAAGCEVLAALMLF